MSTIIEKVNDLNRMILAGEGLQAFDKYYHEDVVMQENENPPTIGKVANRQNEVDFFSSITEFRGATPLKVTVGDNTSMVEWHYDFTHKDWGVRNYKQIAVQEWKDGQIISEKFYYSN